MSEPRSHGDLSCCLLIVREKKENDDKYQHNPKHWTKHLNAEFQVEWVITGDKSPQCFVTSQLSRTSRPELSDLNWWQLYWVGKRRRQGLTDLPLNSCRPDSIGIVYVELHGGDHNSQIPPNRAAATMTHAKTSLFTLYYGRVWPVTIEPSIPQSL